MQSKPLTEQRKKEIASLARRKGRQLHGQMLIEGLRSVESALVAGAPISEVLISAQFNLEGTVADLVRRVGVVVYQISERVAKQIATVASHQGIMAVAKTELTAVEDFKRMPAVLAFDGVQDPGNVGTMIRTAAWFGIAGIIAGPGTADFFNPKVIRATMGGLWDVNVAYAPDLAETLSSLKSNGATVIAADLTGMPLDEWQAGAQTVLVIGEEARGISEDVKNVVDASVVIAGSKHRTGVESLNAAMAAGIIMHRLASTR